MAASGRGSPPYPPVMQPSLDHEDRVLDRMWRERFGQPLPMLGAKAMVLAILGLSERDLKRCSSDAVCDESGCRSN